MHVLALHDLALSTPVAPDSVITISDYWLTLLVATVLPVITALITKQVAPSHLKSVVLLLLSVVSGWLTSLYATGGSFVLKEALLSVIVTFVTAVATHYGLLKPTSVTGRDGAVQRALPGGIGSTRP